MGFGGLAVLNGLLCLAPIGGGGAGRLLEDCGCFADTTSSGMLLVLMDAGGPGGGGAGCWRDIKHGGGGRGGGGRDLLFSLLLFTRCLLP